MMIGNLFYKLQNPILEASSIKFMIKSFTLAK